MALWHPAWLRLWPLKYLQGASNFDRQGCTPTINNRFPVLSAAAPIYTPVVCEYGVQVQLRQLSIPSL
jgi:hypothetical protein